MILVDQSHKNSGETYDWEVNIGSANDLVTLGNKSTPEPMLIQIHAPICRR